MILFGCMIADMLSNKNPNPIVTELLIRGRNLNIFLFLLHNLISLFQEILDYIQHYFVIKIPNKRKLKKIVFNHSSDTEFQDLMNLYKMCTTKPYCFLVIDTTLPSDNFLCLTKNLLKIMLKKLILKTDVGIKYGKLQYHINREAVKISALSSGKIDNYEYLTNEKILPSDQSRILEQAKFTSSPLGKAFGKQRKAIEDQRERQIKAFEEHGK